MQAGVGQRPTKSIPEDLNYRIFTQLLPARALVVRYHQKFFYPPRGSFVGARSPPSQNFDGHFGSNRKCWKKSGHVII